MGELFELILKNAVSPGILGAAGFFIYLRERKINIEAIKEFTKHLKERDEAAHKRALEDIAAKNKIVNMVEKLNDTIRALGKKNSEEFDDITERIMIVESKTSEVLQTSREDTIRREAQRSHTNPRGIKTDE